MQSLEQLESNMTVNEIAARFPSTLPIFAQFGMDTCCGGGLPVAEVTRRHGIELDAVMNALRAAVAATP